MSAVEPEGRVDAVFAAELALGVLDAPARARAEALAGADDAFAAAAVAWAHHLHPLTETVAPVTPSPELWARIERLAGPAVAAPQPALEAAVPPPASTPSSPPPPARKPAQDFAPNPRPRSLPVWRAAAFGAFALAAASLVAAGVEGAHKRAWAPLLATKLLPADGPPVLLAPAPLFAATVDRTRGVVVLTALAPGPVDARDRELWLTRKGAAPVALGVLGAFDTRALRPPAAALRAAGPGATLAVSLEPRGGSRSGRPTGPVIAAGVLGAI